MLFFPVQSLNVRGLHVRKDPFFIASLRRERREQVSQEIPMTEREVRRKATPVE